MSAAHILELESQVDLLNRLEMLSNFGSNLIVINGGEGYGKSWLAQRYLEVGAQDKNQSLVLCRGSQSDEHYRAIILNQISQHALFNEQGDLRTSLHQILDGDECDIAIVVDDAHRLNGGLVSELWMLVLEAKAHPNWIINVLLFTNSGALDSVFTRLCYGQEQKPVELEIDMLSESEARHFFENFIVRYIDEEQERRARNAFKTVSPIPGDLMALGESKVERRIIIRSIVGSPRNIAITVIVLLFIAAGGVWWGGNQSSPDEKAKGVIASIEQDVTHPFGVEEVQSPEDQTVQVEMQELAIEEERQRQQIMAEVLRVDAEDDSWALPPQVSDDVNSVGNAEDDSKRERVVITSDVVDALLEDKPKTVDTSTIDSVVEQSIEPVATEYLTVDAKPTKPETTADLATPVVIPPSHPLNQAIPYGETELEALSPRAYTLQLAAVNNEIDVSTFLLSNNIADQVRVYKTVRSGTDWFIVTYQDFPTIQTARDAVETLPDNLKALNPWAKSLRQVQREIYQAK